MPAEGTVLGEAFYLGEGIKLSVDEVAFVAQP
jgi:hypothetical protein